MLLMVIVVEGEVKSKQGLVSVSLSEARFVCKFNITSSSAALDEPMSISSTSTRLSRSIRFRIFDASGLFESSISESDTSSSGSGLLPSKTVPMRRARPSRPFLILSSLLRTTTKSLMSSPGSTLSSSRSF